MKRNNSAGYSDPSWYRTSPIKLSAKRTSRPPTGKPRIKKGSLLEPDKDIYDRLLSSASISMFDDDEDHSSIAPDDSLMAQEVMKMSYAGGDCLIPALRASTEGRDESNSNSKRKGNRKVSFSQNLVQKSSCSYGGLGSADASAMSVSDRWAVNHDQQDMMRGTGEEGEELGEDQEAYSDFFNHSDKDTDYQSNPSADVRSEYDVVITSHGDVITSHGDVTTSHDDVTTSHDDVTSSAMDYDDYPLNIGIPPPVPAPRMRGNGTGSGMGFGSGIGVGTGMGGEEEEFLNFSVFIHKAMESIEANAFSRDGTDIYDNSISTEQLEARVMKKHEEVMKRGLLSRHSFS